MSGAAVRRPSPVHDAEILNVPLAQRFGSGFPQDLDDLVLEPLALSLSKEVGAAARRRIGDRLLPGRPDVVCPESRTGTIGVDHDHATRTARGPAFPVVQFPRRNAG